MLVLVTLAGRDRLLRLDDITPPHDGSGFADGPMPDACVQGVHGCSPTSFAAGVVYQYSAAGLGGLALSPALVGEYVLVNANVESSSTFGTGTALQPTSIPGTWQRIALSPDAHELYLGAVTGMSSAIWNGTAWSGLTPVADFPSDGALSTPSTSCGELRMMVKRNNVFEEWARVGGVWQPSGVPPLAEPELTGAAEQISDPSLSGDGLVLVFAVAGTTPTAGVWATTRRSLGDSFITPAVQILSFNPTVTPFLSEDCHDLYLEGGTTDLYQWHH